RVAMKNLPVVCTLTPATAAVRKANLLTHLARRATRREDATEGMCFTFQAEDLLSVAQTIEQERQCCRFLAFQLAVEQNGGPVSLTVSGPPGTHEFLRAMIDED